MGVELYAPPRGTGRSFQKRQTAVTAAPSDGVRQFPGAIHSFSTRFGAAQSQAPLCALVLYGLLSLHGRCIMIAVSHQAFVQAVYQRGPVEMFSSLLSSGIWSKIHHQRAPAPPQYPGGCAFHNKGVTRAMVSFRLCQRKLAYGDALVHGLQGGSSFRPCLPVRAGHIERRRHIFTALRHTFPPYLPCSACRLRNGVRSASAFSTGIILRPFTQHTVCCVDGTSGGMYKHIKMELRLSQKCAALPCLFPSRFGKRSTSVQPVNRFLCSTRSPRGVSPTSCLAHINASFCAFFHFPPDMQPADSNFQKTQRLQLYLTHRQHTTFLSE